MGNHGTIYSFVQSIQIKCTSLPNNFNAKKPHRTLKTFRAIHVWKIELRLVQEFNKPYCAGLALANNQSPTLSFTHSHSPSHTFLIHDCKRLVPW